MIKKENYRKLKPVEIKGKKVEIYKKSIRGALDTYKAVWEGGSLIVGAHKKGTVIRDVRKKLNEGKE